MSVIIFSNLLRGVTGLDKSVVCTANNLSKDGYDVHVITIVGRNGGFNDAKPRFYLNPDVKLYTIQSMYPSDASNFELKFQHALTVKQPFLTAEFSKHDLEVLRGIEDRLNNKDFIIFTHPLQSYIYKIACQSTKCRTILQIHGNYEYEPHNLELLLKSREIIKSLQIVSSGMLPSLKKITGFPERSIHFIPNIHESKNILRSPEGKVVAIVGSLQERKNQIDAIKTLETILETEAVIHIWGNTAGQYYTEVKKYLEISPAKDRVVFKGIGSEDEIYKETDIILMTSHSEGFGYIMLEAASHKIPSVVYDFDFGPRDIIENGVNGYIVKKGDYAEAGRKIKKLLEDREHYNCVALNAYNTYLNKFSAEAIVYKYKELIGFEEKHTDLLMLKKNDIRINFLKDFKRVFRWGRHQHDIITLRPIDNLSVNRIELVAKFDPYDVKGRKRVSTTEIRQNISFGNGDVQIKIKSSLLDVKLRGAGRKYLAYLDIDGNKHYLFNTMQGGGWQKVEEYYPQHKVLSGEYDLNQVESLLTSDGLNIKYPSFELVQDITNEHGVSLPYKTVYYKQYGIFTPFINVNGEYNKLTIKMNSGIRLSINIPQLSYSEIYEKVNRLENDYDLCNLVVGDIYIWELIKVSVIESLMEFYGNWGKHFSKVVNIDHSYSGGKSINKLTSAHRLVFEFPRKSDVDKKTITLQTDNAVVIEYPQEKGYSNRSYENGSNVYPIKDFFDFQHSVHLDANEKYKPGILEQIFEREFNINVNFESFVNFRILKYKREYSFWYNLLKKNRFKEVIVPSAYWSPGIIKAAKDNGISTSDVQYALITDKHPNYSFSKRKEYSPDNIYLWSNFWGNDFLPYKSIEVIKNYFVLRQFELLDVSESIDYVVASQPRVGSRINEFVFKLADKFPNKSIVYALHPDESISHYPMTSKLIDMKNVKIVESDTLTYIAKAKSCIGVYSTSLYEAAFLGKKVYVINAPGYDIVQSGIETGIFKLISSADEICDYEVDIITTSMIY